ncbi:MAG TPA: hypothetical protein VIM07_02950 [Chitinophagaceae bacterium]
MLKLTHRNNNNFSDTIAIDFDFEIIEVTYEIMQAEGYLECEKIIIHNIKKQLDNSYDDEKIIVYMKKLCAWFYKKIKVKQGNADCSNFRYSATFMDTLLQMPYWISWIKAIDM